MEFFAFSEIRREVERRLVAESIGVAEHATALRALLPGISISSGARERVHALLDEFEGGALRRTFDGHYRKHAIRVCASMAQHAQFDLEDGWLELALLHNAFEAGDGDMLADCAVGSELLDKVAALTIDRSRERQDSYLSSYYRSIAAADSGLLVMKAFDKLDNHLSYVRLDLDAHHFRVVDDFLCPLLDSLRPDLSTYLRSLTAFSRSAEGRELFAKRFPNWAEDR